jgi:hypothetical protein
MVQFSKPECPVLTKQKNVLIEEDNCSTSSSDVNDDDKTGDEYDEQELLVEF